LVSAKGRGGKGKKKAIESGFIVGRVRCYTTLHTGGFMDSGFMVWSLVITRSGLEGWVFITHYTIGGLVLWLLAIFGGFWGLGGLRLGSVDG